jgi:hypothetical protein
LQRARDSTLEVTPKELRAASRLTFTAQLKDPRRCRIFITTVPAPIDEFKRPDLSPLVNASAAERSIRLLAGASRAKANVRQRVIVAPGGGGRVAGAGHLLSKSAELAINPNRVICRTNAGPAYKGRINLI